MNYKLFRTFAFRMERQRIEYIDAMRGFTMILVVYSHICSFCLGDAQMGYNGVLFLFRLPCFFFISGWLFAGSEDRPFGQVVRRKLMVQIVPTFIFLLLLAPPPLFFSRLGATKGGYWFTFALFEFFVLYLLTMRLGRRWSALLAVVISISAFCYDIYYSRFVTAHVLSLPLTRVLGFLSFMTWRYYLFFFIGTWVRSHFDTFLKWTARPVVIALIALGFLSVAVSPHPEEAVPAYLVFACGGIMGMILVFTFFRLCSSAFTKERIAGRILQYVGTRTLDIYLLHYFFLPRFLLSWGEQLRGLHSPLLEVASACTLSLAVVACCLAASYILRLSPFLAHYLFGVK